MLIFQKRREGRPPDGAWAKAAWAPAASSRAQRLIRQAPEMLAEAGRATRAFESEPYIALPLVATP